jgi:hypothetical protein
MNVTVLYKLNLSISQTIAIIILKACLVKEESHKMSVLGIAAPSYKEKTFTKR